MALASTRHLRQVGGGLADLDTRPAADVTPDYEAQAIVSRLIASGNVDALRKLITAAAEAVPDLRKDLERYQETIGIGSASRLLSVFLCHASEDKQRVRDLYKSLLIAGIDPWLDENKLLPGQDWQLEITKAIEACDAILVCLSKVAIKKEGYVQREVKLALDRAEEKPTGTIFVIPVKLDECPLPPQLKRWQAIDWHEPNRSIELLDKALKVRAKQLGII
jgi:hypothetical protein